MRWVSSIEKRGKGERTHPSNEATALVSRVNLDLDVALQQPARCVGVSLGTERLRLLVGIASGARGADRGKDESELGVELGEDDLWEGRKMSGRTERMRRAGNVP